MSSLQTTSCSIHAGLFKKTFTNKWDVSIMLFQSTNFCGFLPNLNPSIFFPLLKFKPFWPPFAWRVSLAPCFWRVSQNCWDTYVKTLTLQKQLTSMGIGWVCWIYIFRIRKIYLELDFKERATIVHLILDNGCNCFKHYAMLFFGVAKFLA